jgi:hypothetical protein
VIGRLFAALVLAGVMAWARPASAATVTILAPPSPSADGSEALNLLRGELLSIGLTVAIEQPAEHEQSGPDSRRWLEDLAAGGASAVIDPVDVEAGLAVDVWVVRRDPLRFEVTRVAVGADTPKASEVLALQAVEALRAGLILEDRANRKPPTVVTPPPVVVANPVTPQPRERWGFEAGVAVLASLDGVGPAFLPMLRARWAATPSWLAAASLMGAGTRPRVAMPGGSVRVAQQVGTLGACYRLSADRRLWPFVALAAGAVHTGVQGQADADTQGRNVDQWSFVVDASVGTGLRITDRTYATLAAHGQGASPYVVIHSADTTTASTGRPSLAMTLTLGMWL